MKSSVCLVLLFAVVAVASAAALIDEELEDETLQLSNRRFKFRGPIATIGRLVTKIIRKHRELSDESVQTSGFAAGNEALELQEILSPEQYQVVDEDDSLASQNGPSVEKKGCRRVCVTKCGKGGCRRVCGTKCNKRSQIADESVQAASFSEYGRALGQEESLSTVTKRATVCRVCLKKFLSRERCKMCMEPYNQINLQISAFNAAEDGESKVSEKVQKISVQELEEESLTAYRIMYDEQVVKAAKYQLLAPNKDSDVTKEDAVYAVVVTLGEGGRLIILQGDDVRGSKSPTILLANDSTTLADIWTLVDSKNVKNSKVADYLKASDSSANAAEAVNSMMALD